MECLHLRKHGSDLSANKIIIPLLHLETTSAKARKKATHIWVPLPCLDSHVLETNSLKIHPAPINPSYFPTDIIWQDRNLPLTGKPSKA